MTSATGGSSGVRQPGTDPDRDGKGGSFEDSMCSELDSCVHESAFGIYRGHHDIAWTSDSLSPFILRKTSIESQGAWVRYSRFLSDNVEITSISSTQARPM